MRVPFLAPAALAVCLLSSAPCLGQELQPSGTFGIDLFWATNGGVSQLYAFAPASFVTPIPLTAPINNVPSRWAHRRRTLGALETAITYAPPAVLLTPLGDVAGSGGIHFFDARTIPPTSTVIPTGNPPACDITIVPSLQFAFTLEDAGFGNSILRGFSYGTAGQLTALNPAAIQLAGSPSSYVNRLGVEEDVGLLHVPTTSGIYVFSLSNSGTNVNLLSTITAPNGGPTTNPIAVRRPGGTQWFVGTSTFNAPNVAVEAGWLAWDASGASLTGTFGTVPSAPTKKWVPAAGAEELAVCSNGTDAYLYYLLREPGPGTFFVKGSAVGVIRAVGNAAPVTSTIPCSDECGEPFANPAVYGGRVAFETSFGPPFVSAPEDGGERIVLIYSPLDPLGASTLDGKLAIPAPLGGRISTKGMDRPIWSKTGDRVMAFTSHFPGAPNPFLPGIEVLNVPATVAVNPFNSPHQVLPNPTFPYQSIIFPSVFDPRDPTYDSAFGDLTFAGNVFHNGMGSVGAGGLVEIGQYQAASPNFVQSPLIPNFPAILPPSFNDATSSITPVPGNFGARRTTFNLNTGFGLYGLTMVAAYNDSLLLQPSGVNFVAALGLIAPIAPITYALPAGSVTTSEILSL